MARVLLQLVSAPHRSPFETTPLLPPLLPTLIALPPSSSLAQVWALQVACARVVGGVDKDVEAERSPVDVRKHYTPTEVTDGEAKALRAALTEGSDAGGLPQYQAKSVCFMRA
mgnify:CR=1 FL=1